MVVGFDDSWVVNTMRLAQVPILQLLHTYDRLYKAKVKLSFLSFTHVCAGVLVLARCLDV